MSVLTLPGIHSWYAKSKVLRSFKLSLLSMEIRESVLSCRAGGLDFHSGCFVWQKASFCAEPWSSNTTPEFLGLCGEQNYALFWRMPLCEADTAELQRIPSEESRAEQAGASVLWGEGRMLMGQLGHGTAEALLAQPCSPLPGPRPRWPWQ